MPKKKYELTEITRTDIPIDIFAPSVTLHRIRALIDIPNVRVKAGDLGGWIESERNLSQTSDAWVSGEAMVYGNAQVLENALVRDHAKVHWAAIVCGNSRVYDYAEVCDRAKISDHAWVFGYASIAGYAIIRNFAVVGGNVKVYDAASVGGDAWIQDDARILENAYVGGRAYICDDAEIRGYVGGIAAIYGKALIESSSDYLTVGPFSDPGLYATFYKTRENTIRVTYGEFKGEVDEFIKTGGNEYRLSVELAKAHIFGKEDQQ